MYENMNSCWYLPREISSVSQHISALQAAFKAGLYSDDIHTTVKSFVVSADKSERNT